MKLMLTDWIVVGTYFLINLLIGLYYRRSVLSLCCSEVSKYMLPRNPRRSACIIFVAEVLQTTW